MTVIDCYRVLGVRDGAPWSDVKEAYRHLVKKFHPDKNSNDDERSSRFHEISHAYRILEEYHRDNNKTNNQTPFWSSIYCGVPQKNNIFREDSILPAKLKRFNLFKRFHEAIFRLECSWFPLDIYQGVTVDPETVKAGGVIRIRTSKEIFHIKLSKRLRHGSKLRIPGRGQRSWIYNKRGDLYIKLHVIPFAAVTPGSTNLYYEMQIRKEDIDFGKVFTLHTLQGPIKFFPPKNTQDGQVFFLKSRPDDPTSKKLNHILTVKLF
tara:strand:- start:82 stop:873 length:792 start_codon:yes stop_codon:yes gene_type:complete